MPLEPLTKPKIETHLLLPSGAIPNNGRLPLLVYRGVLDADDEAALAAAFETLFDRNGWTNGWRDSIYRYHHFHSNTHEALGIAAGEASVRFGGGDGVAVRVGRGDVVVIPAGVAHCRLDADPDLLVVAGYPDGTEPNMHRETVHEHHAVAARAAQVPVPAADPVYGRGGPLTRHWCV